MSERPRFAYDGSKIVIVPTVSFSETPAKKRKLINTDLESQPIPTVYNFIERRPQVNKSIKELVSSRVLVEPMINQILAVPQNICREDERQSTIKVNVQEQKVIKKKEKPVSSATSGGSWASHFLTNSPLIRKKPITINLSTTSRKSSTTPKVNSLHKELNEVDKNKSQASRSNLKFLDNMNINNKDFDETAQSSNHLDLGFECKSKTLNINSTPSQPQTNSVFHTNSNSGSETINNTTTFPPIHHTKITPTQNIDDKITFVSNKRHYIKNAEDLLHDIKDVKSSTVSRDCRKQNIRSDRDTKSGVSYSNENTKLSQKKIINNKSENKTSFTKCSSSKSNYVENHCKEKNTSECSTSNIKFTDVSNSVHKLKVKKLKEKYRNERRTETKDKDRDKYSKSKTCRNKPEIRSASEERYLRNKERLKRYKIPKLPTPKISNNTKDKIKTEDSGNARRSKDLKKVDEKKEKNFSSVSKTTVGNKVEKYKSSEYSEPYNTENKYPHNKDCDNVVILRKSPRKLRILKKGNKVVEIISRSEKKTTKSVVSSKENNTNTFNKLVVDKKDDLRQKLSRHRNLNVFFSEKRQQNLFLEKRDNLKISVPNENMQQDSSTKSRLKQSTKPETEKEETKIKLKDKMTEYGSKEKTAISESNDKATKSELKEQATNTEMKDILTKLGLQEEVIKAEVKSKLKKVATKSEPNKKYAKFEQKGKVIKKSNKYKKVKLVINVTYEASSTSDSEDSEEQSNPLDKGNVDLSFLDDINIDEIVKGLRDTHSETLKSNETSVKTKSKNNNVEMSLEPHKSKNGRAHNICPSDESSMLSKPSTVESVSQIPYVLLQPQDIKSEPEESIEAIAREIGILQNKEQSNQVFSLCSENAENSIVKEIKTEPLEVDEVSAELSVKDIPATETCVINEVIIEKNGNIEKAIKSEEAVVPDAEKAQKSSEKIKLIVERPKKIESAITQEPSIHNETQNKTKIEVKDEIPNIESHIQYEGIPVPEMIEPLEKAISEIVEGPRTSLNEIPQKITFNNTTQNELMIKTEIVEEVHNKVNSGQNVLSESLSLNTTTGPKTEEAVKVAYLSEPIANCNKTITHVNKRCENNTSEQVQSIPLLALTKNIKEEVEMDNNKTVKDSTFTDEECQDIHDHTLRKIPNKGSILHAENVPTTLVKQNRKDKITVQCDINEVGKPKNIFENQASTNSRPESSLSNYDNISMELREGNNGEILSVMLSNSPTVSKLDKKNTTHNADPSSSAVNNDSEKSNIKENTCITSEEIKKVQTDKNCRNHSPIRSPQNKEDESSGPEGFLTGMDLQIARQLENEMAHNFRHAVKVTSIISKGQFSAIYKCTNSSGGTYAAKVIKSIQNRYTMGVLKEKMLMAVQKEIPRENLNFVYLINGFRVRERYCLFMEYYPKNLREALDEHVKPFTINKVQELSQQLVAAVTVLRNNFIVHSDLKPTHILLDDANKRLKICGFDQAGAFGSHQLVPNIGTVNYRAPEIILGHSVGYSVDVWSTALIMYEMATNNQLFPGRFDNDILYKQICTLGCIPSGMLENSLYRDKHFMRGERFVKISGPHANKIKLIDKFYPSNRLESTIFQAFKTHWRGSKKDRVQHLATLHSFCQLLRQMLVMHPKQRIPIDL